MLLRTATLLIVNKPPGDLPFPSMAITELRRHSLQPSNLTPNLNTESGITCQPDGYYGTSLLNIASAYIQNNPEDGDKNKKVSVFLCHRLDTETSGAVVLALEKKVCTTLNTLFAARQVSKQYLAYCRFTSKVKHDPTNLFLP